MKLLGYRFTIIEQFPGDGGDCFHVIEQRDNLIDATAIMKVLEETDVNWSVYRILLISVWSNKL